METDISSPCVRECCLDKQDVCVGCGRHIDEIIAWSQSTRQQKFEIIHRAHERKMKLAGSGQKP